MDEMLAKLFPITNDINASIFLILEPNLRRVLLALSKLAAF